MAVEDQEYDALMKQVNALLKTGRTAMVRTWLVKLAMDILKHYGYEVTTQAESEPAASCPTVSTPK